jgi:hypothetical protein
MLGANRLPECDVRLESLERVPLEVLTGPAGHDATRTPPRTPEHRTAPVPCAV